MMLIKLVFCAVCIALNSHSTTAGSFQGCYRENKRQRYFGVSPGGYDPYRLNVASCQDVCRAYKYQYAGLTGNKDGSMGFCFCGNELPPVDVQENNGFCDNACSDGTVDYCGGFDHVAIHKTGIPIEGIALSSDAPSGVTEIFTPVKFEYGMAAGPSGVLYQMEFGDGAEKSVGNATNMDTKIFSMPGEYVVTVHVEDVDIPTLSKKYSVKVLSQSPVSSVTLLCPEFAITYEEVQCNASVVQGSLMQVNMTWQDGTSDNFPIADSLLHAAGPAVPNAEIASMGMSGSDVTGTVVLMLGSEFQHEGELLGFEFFTHYTSGSTDGWEIYVLSPDCSSTGNAYCHQTRSCSPNCGVYGEASCTTFCISKGGCVENSCSATSRTLGVDPKFTVLKVYSISPSPANAYDTYQINAVDRIQVNPGDILGYKALGNITVATRSLDVGELSDEEANVNSAVAGDTGLTSSGSSVGERFLLRAVAARTSWVLFHHEYTQPGEYDLSVRVSTDMISSSVTDTFTLIVLEGIDFVIIQAPEFGVTGEDVTFTILPHTGTNVTHTWDWGDSLMNESAELTFTHVYTQPGVYNVTVVASNPLTARENTTLIIIQDRMVNVSVESEVAEVNSVHSMIFTADSGTDYSCVWDINTNPGVTFTTNVTSSPISGGEATHTYTDDGEYSVTVNCSNDVSFDVYEFSQTTQYPIEGLTVDPTGAIVGEDFYIEWTIQQGTDAKYKVTFDDVVKTHGGDDTLGGQSELMTGLTTGIYNLTVFAENLVSNETFQVDFVVEERMEGVQVSVDQQVISKGDTVTFTVQAQAGTSIEILYDYQDGSNDTFSKGLLVAWAPGDTDAKTHTFLVGGIYHVSITVSNNFDELAFTKTITVFNSVDSLTVNAGEAQEFLNEPAEVSVQFMSDEEPPTLATAVIDWGDGSEPDIRPNITLGTFYTHRYTSDGSYEVSVNVSNAVSSILLVTRVYLVVPVVNMVLKTEPTHASVAEPLKLHIIMEKGPQVTLYVDWGEGPLETSARTGLTAWDIDERTHNYNTVGHYEISVTASNMLGNTTKTYNLVVQNPVLKNFTVTTSTAISYNPAGGNSMSLTLEYPSTLTLPDDATFTVDYGDGQAPTEMSLPFSTAPYTTTESHDFSQPGAYTVLVVIENLATRVVIEVQMGVYEDISGLDGYATWRPHEPYNNTLMRGQGPTKDYFPLDHDVIFKMNVEGTVVKWLVSMVDSMAEAIQMCDFTATESPTVQFNTTGTWEVDVTAWNELSDDNKNFTLVIFQPPVGLNIMDQGTSKMNETKHLELTFEAIGEDSCVVIDWGDDSQEELYADDPECTHIFRNLTISGGVDQVMAVNHMYSTEGQFEVRVSASDVHNITHILETIQFPVTDVDCQAPSLQIENQSPAGSEVRKEKRSSTFYIKAKTNLRCPVTLQNEKRWTAHKMNHYGTPTQEIVLTDYSSTNPELTIRARSLDYGLYRFTYRVQMDTSAFPNKEIFAAEIETYVEIVNSELTAGLQHSGISFIVRGNDQLVTLDAGAYSRDPDVDPNGDQGFTSYEWRCQDVMDVNVNWSSSSLPQTTAEIANTPNDGGCFRQGPGSIGTSDGSLTFSTQNMQVDHTYEFTTVVRKDERSATTTLRLMIVEGTPPAIEIECSNIGFCQPVSDGLMVSLGNRLKLKATCAACDLDSLELHWSMQRKGLVNSWIQVANLDEYVQGLQSKEIAISPQLFEDGFGLYENMSVYRVTLNATDGNSTGMVYTTLRLNEGPSPKDCSVTPTEGKVLIDTFNISCNEWHDQHGISYYQFYATFPDVDTELHLSFADRPNLITELPEGAHWDNYNMMLWVRVADGMGATTQRQIGTVQVVPADETELAVNITKYLLEAERITAEGNLWNVNTIYQTVASALNLQRNYDMSSYGALGVASNTTATGYGPDTHNPLVPTNVYQATNLTDEEKEQIKEAYEKARNERAELREGMVTSLQNLTIEGVGDILFTSTTLSQICKMPEELSRATQVAVVSMLGDITDRLHALANDTAIEKLRQAVAMAADVVGSTLEGANKDIYDPLDTDLKEAQQTEIYYYDTDLDSQRKGFSEDSFEEAQIGLQGETNAIVQRNEMDTMVPDALQAVQDLSRMLSQAMAPGENASEITTPKMSLTVAKDSAENLLKRNHSEGDGSFFLPNWCDMLPGKHDCSNTEKISLISIATPSNIFGHAENSESVLGFSNTITIDLYDEQGNNIEVTNSTVPIQIFIPRDPQMDIPQPELFQVETTEASSSLFYHKFNVSSQGSSLHIEITPEDTSVQFLVLVRLGDFPRLNGTDRAWDHLALVPRNMSALESGEPSIDQYTVFIDNTQIRDFVGTVYVGMRELDVAEHDLYSQTNPPPVAEPTEWIFSTSYTTLTWTSGCYFEKDGLWQSHGCAVQPSTQYTQTDCHCNHLTSFAGGFFVAPNTIDFEFVFSNLDFFSNPTLYITEILVAVLYIVFAIWARREDKKDLEKLGVSPLPDNDPKDKYLYEVQVSTGSRKNAATDSNVSMIFSGEYDETDVRSFADPKRKMFRRGTTNNFLMAVHGPLGPIQYARIWHDNSGKGKFQGWYCRHIVVHDLQTKEKFFFIVNKWFAVEEDTGQIDRLFPVAGPENLVEFDVLFSQKTRKNLSDEHLWFSVVARPPQSRFTRLQRVSCCLCLLFTSMLASAMFYQRTASGSGQNTLVIGPFALTPEQVYVGVISNLIVFPVNFLIVTLFRKSRPRRKRKSRIEEALKSYQSNVRVSSASSDNDKRQLVQDQHLDSQFSSIDSRSSTPKLSPAQPLQPAHQPNMTALKMDRFSKTQNKDGAEGKSLKKKAAFSFPWWCQIVAWLLLWLVTLTSVAFVTFYGISFEDVKCKKWISSMIISFLTSIFLTQPIKVFLVALTLALVFKKADMEEDGNEDEEDVKLENDETWLHHYPAPDEFLSAHSRKLTYKPPDPQILEKAREHRLKEIKMYDILREILFYSFFLWILLVVSYGFRDPNAYHMKRSLDNTFVDNGLGKVHVVSTPDNDFRKVVTHSNFFNWLKDVHGSSLRASFWYNGDQPFFQRGMATDRISRIMGFATLRQLRVKRDLCKSLKNLREIVPKCNKLYSMMDDDAGVYGVKWAPLQVNGTWNNSKPEFTHRTGEEIDTYPYWGKHGFYSGGGYLVQMSGSLPDVHAKVDELMADEWIDKYTRAVFVEFTVYNAQVNLFGIVTMVAEFLTSGGIATSHRIEPMNLLGYSSSAQGFQIACEVMYLLFILFFIIKEIRNLYKERKQYFKQFWNWVEMCIIVLSITCVVIYFYRWYHAKELTERFKETHGNAYMKFQYAAYWNEVLTYFMGLLCFLASIKFIRLLRFNRRMGMLAATLSYGAKPLFLFLIMFLIMFMAYAQFFYLIYYFRVDNFRTLVHTMQTLLQMLVGKFNFNAMQTADPIMGPLVFSFYVVTVYYILINMFLTILNESFAAVRADIAKQTNDHEMVEFIMARFKQWTGLNAIFSANKKAEEMMKKPTVEEQMEAFPEKIDRLLDVLCHAYLNSDHFDAMFDSSSTEGKMAMKNLMKAQQAGGGGKSLVAPAYTTLQVEPADMGSYGRGPGVMHGGARPKMKY